MLPTLLVKGNLVPLMGESKSELDKIVPIDYIMNWIESKLPKHRNDLTEKLTISDRVILLQSMTGSGKSSSIAPNLYLRFFKRTYKTILITQPRVLTTLSIPRDIAKIPAYKKENKDGLSIKLFENLGFQTQEFIRKPLKKGILFTTTGIILQYLKNMSDIDFINKYSFVIIDEAHERSLDVDLVLKLMKELILRNLKRNPPFLILMSGTLNIEKYAKYFKTTTKFRVNGFSYPIKTYYPENDIEGYKRNIISIIKKIHTTNQSDFMDKNKVVLKNQGDIIVFVSGKLYIKLLSEMIDECNKEFEYKVLAIGVDSDRFNYAGIDYKNLQVDLKNISIEVNNKMYTPTRKIIIATNVIETGFTLDSLKYCIDSGFTTYVSFNPNLNTIIMYNGIVTQNSSDQRRGRTGRKSPGFFYPLYTEKSYNLFIKDNIPSIYTEDMSVSLLNMMISNPNLHFKKLDLLDEIPIDSLELSLNKLYILGMIDINSKVSPLGLLINKFRKLSIESCKMILAGYYYNVNILDLLTLAIFLNTPGNKIFENKFKRYQNIFEDISCNNYNILKNKLLISCDFIDFIIFFNNFIKEIYNSKFDTEYIKNWCIQNKVKYNGLIKIIHQRDELIKIMLFSLNLNPFKNIHKNLKNLLNIFDQKNNQSTEFIDEVINIKKCIYEGYKMNIAKLNENNEYISIYNNNVIIIDKPITKTLPVMNNGEPFRQYKPKMILYANSTLRLNHLTNIFNIDVIGPVCILDGYVDIDDGLNIS